MEEAVRIRIRERSKEDGVRDHQHRGRNRDADRLSGNGRGRKRRVAPPEAAGEAEVVDDVAEPRPAAPDRTRDRPDRLTAVPPASPALPHLLRVSNSSARSPRITPRSSGGSVRSSSQRANPRRSHALRPFSSWMPCHIRACSARALLEGRDAARSDGKVALRLACAFRSAGGIARAQVALVDKPVERRVCGANRHRAVRRALRSRAGWLAP